MKEISRAKMEFKPTKEWLKDHKEHPKSCNIKACHCLVDDWQGDYGVCVGIQTDNDSVPDIVSFCCSYYSPEDDKPVGHRFLWHPQEANWIATLLSLASVDAWGMVAQYRLLLRGLTRKRERGIGGHKMDREERV